MQVYLYFIVSSLLTRQPWLANAKKAKLNYSKDWNLLSVQS